MEADPTEVRTSAKPLEAVKQESRGNQAVTTPGKKAQEEVGTSKGASSSGQENPGQTGVEPEQGEYWQYSQEEWEQWAAPLPRFLLSDSAGEEAAAVTAALLPVSLASIDLKAPPCA